MDEPKEEIAISQEVVVPQKIEEEKLPGIGQPFESNLNEGEMDFLQKLMPKGFSLSNSFRSTRPRVSKYVTTTNLD